MKPPRNHQPRKCWPAWSNASPITTPRTVSAYCAPRRAAIDLPPAQGTDRSIAEKPRGGGKSASRSAVPRLMSVGDNSGRYRRSGTTRLQLACLCPPARIVPSAQGRRGAASSPLHLATALKNFGSRTSTPRRHGSFNQLKDNGGGVNGIDTGGRIFPSQTPAPGRIVPSASGRGPGAIIFSWRSFDLKLVNTPPIVLLTQSRSSPHRG
jgi:hypothetical protein